MFDVVRTLVDRRPGIAGAFERVGARVGARADWPGLTTQWRGPCAERVAGGVGEVPWRSLGELHRMMLDEALAGHGLSESATVRASAMPANRSNPMDHALPTSGDHIGTEGQVQAFVPRRSG
ncbi:hypothetical protein ACWC09_31950 [Streptomyces sp. NPDC001617]